MKRLILLFSVSIFLIFATVNCEVEESTTEKAEKEQESIMQRARSQEPTYHPKNFLTRKNVNKWMKRMDDPSKIFYIYVMADNGSITHYFVAQYRPVSTATFLTPPKREWDIWEQNVLGPAPALDGVFYGDGAGDQYFFFDAETDAFISLKGLNYILSDQPLRVDAPKINIAVKKSEE